MQQSKHVCTELGQRLSIRTGFSYRMETFNLNYPNYKLCLVKNQKYYSYHAKNGSSNALLCKFVVKYALKLRITFGNMTHIGDTFTIIM